MLIAGLSALISVIIAYGAIASTIVGMLGPIFIPFLVFDKLDFLFWGWLRAFLGFSFYKVVAAATLSILSQLLAHYYAIMSGFVDPGQMVKQLPYADPSGPRQRFHPAQDSGHDSNHLLRTHGRT